MKTKTVKVIGIAFISLISLYGLAEPANGTVSGTGSVTNDFVKKDGKISLTERKGADGETVARAPRAEDVMKEMPDDGVFIKIGDDELTWGALKTQANLELNVKADAILAMAGSEGYNVSMGLYIKGVTRLLQRYLLTAVIAYDAKQKGLQVDAKEFDKELAKTRESVPVLNAYQYQYATNNVYMRAYVDKYLRPNVKVSDEDVAMLIKERHESNLSVPATNEMFRATLADVRERIVKGELSFTDAVDVYSECGDCTSNGGDCGTWEEDEDSLDPALKAVCFSIPTNTLSEVIETPDAYHLVKIKSRYVPTAKAREEDGEVSSVDVLHIQIDKWPLDPEYTEETARKHLENVFLKRELRRRQKELLKSAPIESVVPLTSPDAKKRKAHIVL